MLLHSSQNKNYIPSKFRLDDEIGVSIITEIILKLKMFQNISSLISYHLNETMVRTEQEFLLIKLMSAPLLAKNFKHLSAASQQSCC